MIDYGGIIDGLALGHILFAALLIGVGLFISKGDSND